jgi:hypothetical protein
MPRHAPRSGRNSLWLNCSLPPRITNGISRCYFYPGQKYFLNLIRFRQKHRRSYGKIGRAGEGGTGCSRCFSFSGGQPRGTFERVCRFLFAFTPGEHIYISADRIETTGLPVRLTRRRGKSEYTPLMPHELT